MQSNSQSKYIQKINHLKSSLLNNNQPLKIRKNSISNLFRYNGRNEIDSRKIDLSKFNNPLVLDLKNKTLEVEGVTTWERIVDYTLPFGLIPFVTPELKHITVGGSIVGIGIESNTHKFGFVHNSLLEADVLLSNGQIITCNAANKYKDLFHALANSYGTLGYVLRAKIQLKPVKRFVWLTTAKFTLIDKFLKAASTATKDTSIDYVEGLAYSKTKLYLTTGKSTNTSENLKSIYTTSPFYKEISKNNRFTLPTKEYIFRYDPEWFWNLPENPLYLLFRAIAPKSLKNSGVYALYTKIVTPKAFQTTASDTFETLIQDWEVPMKQAKKLMDFALTTVDLSGKPLMVAFVKVPKSATLYPMNKNKLYLNLGSYSFAKRKHNKPLYYYTKIIDEFCFKHNGIKMLYSSTFLTKKKFDKIYNGHEYDKLKQKYDPKNLLPTLFEKAVKSK